MCSYAKSKMSLQAQFDDLCRYTAILTPGCGKEFKTFAQVQKKLHQGIKDLMSENRKLLRRINDMETEKLGFETKLKHARNLLISGDEKYRKLEQEKISLERQIVLIKELLADENGMDNQTKEKLFQLSTGYSQQNDFVSRLTTIEESGSLLSSSDCDETVESIETYNRRKRSTTCNENMKASVHEKELKDHKRYLSVENVFTFEEVVIPNKNVTYRSSSEPTSSSPEKPAPRQVIRSDSENFREHSFNSKRSSFVRGRSSLPLSRCSADGKLSRNHAFAAKTYIRSEKCHPCGKMIKFCKQGLKCSDCRISCHIECKEQCVIPCIPININPCRGLVGTIADYTTSVSPMIPSIIVHCVNEIESREFQDIGLYRVPGSERQIKEIKDKFLKGKSVPLLNEIDVHAICGTIKEFLRSLKESLITKSSWMSFADTANNGEENVQLKLYDLVSQLPQPNRETLAFLILHLQRIAEAPLCKMPICNLAKVFGPTIVGYSSDEDVNLLLENKLQNKVMEMLLKIPSELWQKLLNNESNKYNTKLRSPECLPAPVASRLGPIYSSQKSETLLPGVKSNFSPRADGRKRKYFSSPKLK